MMQKRPPAGPCRTLSKSSSSFAEVERQLRAQGRLQAANADGLAKLRSTDC
jgi:hypothetical protein